MNETREKLVNIISEQTCFQSPCISGCNQCRQLADSLISSGLIFNPETDIRPKFKIGQEVFDIIEDNGTMRLAIRSEKFKVIGFGNNSCFVQNGHNIHEIENSRLFLTKTKAQVALKERKNGQQRD